MRTAFPAIAVIAIYYALLLGLLNIMEAMGQRVASVADGVGRVTHVAIWEGPAVIPALLGVFMLILAYELWLRKRAALIVLCGFVITQAFVDTFRGMSRTALGVTVLIAMVLAMSVKEFPGRTDSLAVKRLKVTLPVLAAGFFAYGITGIYLMRHWLGVRDVNIYGLAYRSVAVAVGPELPRGDPGVPEFDDVHRDGLDRFRTVPPVEALPGGIRAVARGPETGESPRGELRHGLPGLFQPAQ
jgi:hypothetical protein